MSQNYYWPPGFATASNPSIGTTGSTAPTSATEVAGVDGSSNLRALSVDSTGKLNVNISSGIANPLPVTDAAAEASLASIDAKLPSPIGAHVTAASLAVNIASDQVVPISASALPLPSGASTSALQTSGNASLTSIDGKLNSLGQKAMAASVPVVIASDQSAVPISAASLPLPSGAATSALQTSGNASLSSIDATILARLTGSLVPKAFDEIDLTYVPSGAGAGQIQTAVYKLATVTQKTLTLSYDGSDRLSSVVAS